jgi:hypothetical protein
MPRRISPTTRTLSQRERASMPAYHARTFASARSLFRSSEMTFVSSNHPFKGRPSAIGLWVVRSLRQPPRPASPPASF